MSVESAVETDEGYVDAEDCADWRERAGDGDLCKDIATGTSFHRSTVNKHVRGRDGCSHDALDDHPDPVPHTDGPGVHALADATSTTRVREAIHERLDSTLGDTCYFSAGQLVAGHDLDLAGQHASAVLRGLADDGGDLVVERTNPGANQARWMATRVGGEQVVTDGGTSLNDANTVAWCPGCRRFIAAENEVTHARTKHLRSYPGEIQSRYRHVSWAHLPASALNTFSDGGNESDASEYQIDEALE